MSGIGFSVPPSLNSPVADDPPEQTELDREEEVQGSFRVDLIHGANRGSAARRDSNSHVGGSKSFRATCLRPRVLVRQRYRGPSQERHGASPPGVGVVTLAVLPLTNYLGDVRRDAFSNGLTEALMAQTGPAAWPAGDVPHIIDARAGTKGDAPGDCSAARCRISSSKAPS